jgi:CheY-like chemotaxis protein
MTSTILVVDDEPDLETLVQQKFRRRIPDGQVRFLFARDGAEALEMLADRGGVDMVVSDINMPHPRFGSQRPSDGRSQTDSRRQSRDGFPCTAA